MAHTSFCLSTYLTTGDIEEAWNLFWKTIKPHFSKKGLNSNKTFLHEKGRLIKYPVATAATMNDYFVNLTTLIIYSKIMQVLLKSNLVWTMFQINLIVKMGMTKKSNGKS